jgi:hypothetical protein
VIQLYDELHISLSNKIRTPKSRETFPLTQNRVERFFVGTGMSPMREFSQGLHMSSIPQPRWAKG